MKKNMATAMAAAMAFGAVVPAFADTVENYALTPDAITGEYKVDVRLAEGYKLVNGGTVVTRVDAYNTNGTTDRNDDTLKTAFKDYKLVTKEEMKDEKKSAQDKFVFAQKETNIAKVNDEKANKGTAEALIAKAKNEGLKVETTNVAAKLVDGIFTDSLVKITITNKDNTKTVYNFVGSEGVKDDATSVTAAALYKEIFAGLYDGMSSTPELNLEDKADYAKVNKLKYTIEQNINKFDVAKEEENGNQDIRVKLYVKGSDKTKPENLVLNIAFDNFATEASKKLIKENIVNMPLVANSDFNAHWAKNEIIDAMLSGKVDANAKFRPQDSITRAEFAKIACTVYGVAVDEKTQVEPFHDVNNGDWFQKYVAALYSEKVVEGDGQNFRPNDKITREEVAIIVAKLIKGDALDKEDVIIGYDKDNKAIYGHNDAVTKFLDDKDIHVWADDSVKFLNENTKYGADNKPVVEGTDKKFNPTQAITRAEALVMVQRAETATIK